MEYLMTTIEQHGSCATLINVFTVEPERATELAELLRVAAERKVDAFGRGKLVGTLENSGS